jgi:deoxyribonuclease-4
MPTKTKPSVNTVPPVDDTAPKSANATTAPHKAAKVKAGSAPKAVKAAKTTQPDKPSKANKPTGEQIVVTVAEKGKPAKPKQTSEKAAAPTERVLKTTSVPARDPIGFGTVGAPQGTPKSGTVAAIEYSRLLGFDHLEIAWVQSVRVTDEACAEIKAAAARHHLTLSIHAPYYINLNSQTAELMAKSDERLLAAARKGFLAGARDIVFHPGSYHSQPAEQVYERAKEKLLELTAILRAEGTEVWLRPETMGKNAMFGSLDEVIQLSAEVPGVLPAIDFAHLHARTGDGTANSYAEFDAMLTRLEKGLGRHGLENMHCHLSGIAYNPKGERFHLPLNEADMQYIALLQALVDHEACGTIAVEAPMPFHVADALTIQATYRRIRDRKEGAEAVPDGELEQIAD